MEKVLIRRAWSIYQLSKESMSIITSKKELRNQKKAISKSSFTQTLNKRSTKRIYNL